MSALFNYKYISRDMSAEQQKDTQGLNYCPAQESTQAKFIDLCGNVEKVNGSKMDVTCDVLESEIRSDHTRDTFSLRCFR